MELTYTQCKQINHEYGPHWRNTIECLQDQPEWIKASEHFSSTRDCPFNHYGAPSVMSVYDILAVQQGGCASGAWMPAVTYHSALETMRLYGDEVLEYIEEQCGELPTPETGISWSGMAVLYLSCAIELWCAQFDLEGVDW